ncbi:Uncharacterized Fe-S center protein [Pelotomaculum thermopropionicum SI]|uniref:Uncharacterized Fe-S center protein n=1 Tax=Pelotomaculum thermopropionicum (strain DSM 13744 / JCM 10971 / SI) TaxID=370438 RepID=A5CYX0_PELTS|nr:Uncharacterized Fe-S center protein [Pelotomaculum thermopropionicum SI]
MSDVFMVSARAAGVEDNYIGKIGLLLSAPGFAGMIPQGKNEYTVIKGNFSQVGYTRHIRPVLMRAVVEKVREFGGTPVITDTSGFFPKGRYSGDQWYTAAEMMGYSELALGCERVIANGYEGNDGEFVSTGGVELGGVEVARAVREAACIVMVSHLTAHPQAGMSGALLNLGVECLNNAGKARIYQGLKPGRDELACRSCGICADYCQWEALQYANGLLSYDESACSGCGFCLLVCPHKARRLSRDDTAAFQRRVAESAAAIVKTLKKKIIFINFLIDIVPQPYRFPWSDGPFVPDLGFLASTDPVAVDSLSMELIARAPGIPGSAAEDAGALAGGVEKFKALTGADPAVMLGHAEMLGLGSRDFEIYLAGR